MAAPRDTTYHKTRDEAIESAKLAIEEAAVDDDDGGIQIGIGKPDYDGADKEDPLGDGHTRKNCWCQPEVIHHMGSTITVHQRKQ